MSPPLLVENNYDVSADVISDLIDWLLPLLFLQIVMAFDNDIIDSADINSEPTPFRSGKN